MKMLLILMILLSVANADEYNSLGQKLNYDTDCIDGNLYHLSKYYSVDLKKTCLMDEDRTEFCEDGKLFYREGKKKNKVYDTNNTQKDCP